MNLSDNVDTGSSPLDDSTPRNSEDNDETIHIPIHGNCPKCRHLHTDHWFRFPRDPTKHTRFQCEECSHQIFGIGRSSTQTTLASVESITPSRRNSGQPRLSNLHVCVNTPTPLPDVQADSPRSPEQVNVPGHLTPIAETNTVGGRSRSISLQGPNSASPGREAIQTENTSHVVDNPTRETEGGHQARLSPSRIKGIIRRLRNRKRIAGEARKIKFLGYQISVTRIASESRRLSPYASQEIGDPNPLGLATQPVETPVFAGGRLVPRHSTSERQISTPPSADQPNPNPNPDPDPTHETMELGTDTQLPHPPISSSDSSRPITDDGSAEAKQNRIKVRRREKTLKSEAARRPVCSCVPGCPCIPSNGHFSDDSISHGRELAMSEISGYAPGYALGYPRRGVFDASSGSSGSQHSQAPSNPIHLAGIGNHFSGIRRASATDGSSSSSTSQIHLNRLSYSTTIYGSNDSAISLLPGRNLGARTSSVHGLPLNRPGAQQSHLHPMHVPVNQPRMTESPLRNQGLNIPTSEGNGDENVSRVATPASATNFSRLPDSELEPGQTQQIDDNMSSSSHTLSANNGVGLSSQERTPRPRSQNELVNDSLDSSPAPDVLAEQLRNLSPDQPATGSSTPES